MFSKCTVVAKNGERVTLKETYIIERIQRFINKGYVFGNKSEIDQFIKGKLPTGVPWDWQRRPNVQPQVQMAS